MLISQNDEKILLHQIQLFDNDKQNIKMPDDSSPYSYSSKISPGINKLENLTKQLALDPKKSNIMNPKILESWINETLLEVERQDIKGI